MAASAVKANRKLLQTPRNTDTRKPVRVALQVKSMYSAPVRVEHPRVAAGPNRCRQRKVGKKTPFSGTHRKMSRQNSRSPRDTRHFVRQDRVPWWWKDHLRSRQRPRSARHGNASARVLYLPRVEVTSALANRESCLRDHPIPPRAIWTRTCEFRSPRAT